MRRGLSTISNFKRSNPVGSPLEIFIEDCERVVGIFEDNNPIPFARYRSIDRDFNGLRIRLAYDFNGNEDSIQNWKKYRFKVYDSVLDDEIFVDKIFV